jgi:spore maturation protein SpmB
MEYLIIGYIFVVILVSIIKKVNGYDAFIVGVKDGSRTVINMFGNMLGFVLVVEAIKGCGIIEDLGSIFNPNLFIQAIIRPLSASSSMAIMIETFQTYGIDSPTSIASTFIHTTVDTTFYIIVLYFSSCEIKKYRYAMALGLIVNILAYIIIFAFLVIFFNF